MKIAIPIVNIDIMKNNIASSLSVVGSICIYDTETDVANHMRTLDLAPNMGELLPALAFEGVRVIVSQQVHPMALKVLVNSGFKVFRASGVDVDKNIQMYKAGELMKFDMGGAMEFADACGGACDACDVECKDTK